MGNSGAEFLTSKTRRGFSIAGASALIGAGLAPGAIAGGLLVDPEYTSPFAAAVVGSIAPWAMLALATGIEQQSLNSPV